MKKIFLYIPILFGFSTCTKEITLDEDVLREQLGLGKQKLTNLQIKKIKGRTSEIHFENIYEAKLFMENVNDFSKAQITFFNKKNDLFTIKHKSNQLSVQLNLNELHMNCPPPVFQEFIPCEGGQGGSGCGNGSVLLTSGNMSINLHLNVGFNYSSNDQGTNASNFNSHLSGFTLGLSYEHLYSNYNVSGSTISFTVDGVINYNLFVDGIGTIYTQNVRITGSYNPCTGQGSIQTTSPPQIFH